MNLRYLSILHSFLAKLKHRYQVAQYIHQFQATELHPNSSTSRAGGIYPMSGDEQGGALRHFTFLYGDYVRTVSEVLAKEDAELVQQNSGLLIY
mmetsp:Transcript_14395/g.22352  ORF Transcript_14395/g.22352 Transcript_14395/m.22352 type:complete len:94 (-) Transcript_14395:878-1159(-)